MTLSEDTPQTQTIELSRKEEIKNKLPDATDEQVERFLAQVERIEALKKYFETYPEDQQRFLDILARVNKALDYKKPYRIVVIGVTGAGKSTLNNALLGDDRVPMRPVGKPATGTVLEIFLDMPETEPQKAIVEYRDERDIREIIYDFVRNYKRYGLDTSWLNSRLDLGFVNQLSTMEPQQKITEAEVRNNFQRLRETLTDIVKQYINNNVSSLRREFLLDNSRDVEELNQLIDEHSNLNAENSPYRRIGLVKTVVYRLHPLQSKTDIQALQLAQNVCIVDLPGLDGSPLHNIIIREEIKKADAVIYIIKDPKRIGTDSDFDLLSNVRKHVGLEGSAESYEGVFFVLNAIDSVTEDKIPENLSQDMRSLIEKFLPGYTKYPHLSNRGTNAHPYFPVSSLAALLAQKALRGQTQKDPDTYESLKLKLGVKDGSDRQVLEASQIPKLVEELTNFARDRRIEGQIRDGKLAINSIVEALCSEFETEKLQLTDNEGTIHIQEKKKVKQTLQEQQQSLEDVVYEFRSNQLASIERWKQELDKEAKHICDLVDNELKKNMPLLWKEAVHSKWLLGHPNRVNRAMAEYIVDRTQINLWKQIAIQVPRLAKYLVQVYSSSLESYKMAQKIATGCYDYQEVSVLESKIQKWIVSMQHTMVEVAGRIALTKMTDPACAFLTPDGKLEKRQLVDTLPKAPRQSNSNIPDTDFNTFIAEVRKEYEPHVSDDCIIGLLNLYRYEMMLIEDRLLNLIEEIFYELGKSENSVFKSKILESLNKDPAWKRLKLLEAKLAALAPIRQ